MKVLVNSCYGGFSISKEASEKYGYSIYDENARYDEKIIAAFERGEDVEGNFAEFRVVELPEETTDYYVNEYDGCETVIYVVDGKLYFD